MGTLKTLKEYVSEHQKERAERQHKEDLEKRLEKFDLLRKILHKFEEVFAGELFMLYDAGIKWEVKIIRDHTVIQFIYAETSDVIYSLKINTNGKFQWKGQWGFWSHDSIMTEIHDRLLITLKKYTTMEKIKLSKEEIIGHLPEETILFPIDYRDSFSESLDSVQKAIHTGDNSVLNECIIWESYDQEKAYLDELENDLNNIYDIDYADELIEEYKDEIFDEISGRDVSPSPVEGILKNTPAESFFYDTGYEIGSETWSWNKEEITEAVEEIKETLGIIGKTDDKDDHNIKQMVLQASYGGRLVLYFSSKPKELTEISKEVNTISFKNPIIAIIDNMNGSGDHTEVKPEIKIPFTRENLFIDRLISYSYVHEVCGMIDSWCDQVKVSFSIEEQAEAPKKSEINNYLDKEKELDETFKAGKCTFGDKNMKRHRDVYYTNEFPCGNICPHCGTFWID